MIASYYDNDMIVVAVIILIITKSRSNIYEISLQ